MACSSCAPSPRSSMPTWLRQASRAAVFHASSRSHVSANSDQPKLAGGESSCNDCVLFSLCFAQDIDADARERLSDVIQRRQGVQRSAHLHHGGQPARQLTVLRSGSIKAYEVSREGDELVTGFYLPGDVVGLDAFSMGHHAGSAVALEECRLCEIPVADFQKMLGESPRLNQVMLRLLAEEMAEARKLLLVVGRLDARTRVALFLLSLSRRFERRQLDPDLFRLSMDRRDIANYLGLTIETVSRTLSALQRDDVIHIRGKHVRILDREALAEQAHVEEASPSRQAVG
ncbi:transcriptional regulator FNR [Wenzhouxiangella sp. 15181]|nr:transcriptional regulator FNR [Wenzhouxiangella sp. 15181]RFP69169.1 transcriptional regulator FNR [Wenzhouxiangella sp. 15190]